MTDPLQWPALSGYAGEPIGGCRRGIWGKVHGEASDYRWIARGEGFGAGCPRLADALRIGNEDMPVTAPLWRRLPDRWLACAVYPSRARDRSGRLTVIEKQVLEWQPIPAIPAAIGALYLLSEVARFDDSDWWDRRCEGYWQQPEYALDIADMDFSRVAVDTASLSKRIEDARAELTRAVTGDALRSFYSRLLGGRFPTRLPGPQDGKPMPPAALAALLLPLPRSWADRLSLAGAVASTRIDPQDLIRNWDACMVAAGLDEDLALDPEVRQLADAMTAALLDGDAERLPFAPGPRNCAHPFPLDRGESRRA